MDRNIYNFVFLLRSMPFRLIVSILVFFLTLNFVFSATYTCYNCSNCTATIALASANDVVQLNQSITVNLSASSACIDFQTTDTITFDCLHHRNFLRGNSSGYGIFIPNVRNNIVITNCNVSYFEKGIYIGISNNDIITNNLVEHNDEGIDMYTATNATLRNNTLRNNSVAGMYLFGFDGSVAENNVFRENSRGLYVVMAFNLELVRIVIVVLILLFKLVIVF
jgi:parallel beta-helix repeat protein